MRKLNGIENGIMMEVTDGPPSMELEMVHELDVVKDKKTNTIKLIRAR